jgi:hypothetical protein
MIFDTKMPHEKISWKTLLKFAVKQHGMDIHNWGLHHVLAMTW